MTNKENDEDALLGMVIIGLVSTFLLWLFGGFGFIFWAVKWLILTALSSVVQTIVMVGLVAVVSLLAKKYLFSKPK